MISEEKTLGAIANNNRIKIIRFLKMEKKATTVGEIAKAIKLSFGGTSKHLRLLDTADIIKMRKESLEVYYSLDDNMPPLSKLIINAL